MSLFFKRAMVGRDILMKLNDINHGDPHRANSIFWTQALNIPFPASYVFQRAQLERDRGGCIASDTCTNPDSAEKLGNGENEKPTEMNKSTSQVSESESTSQGEIIWVECLVPDIDFCDHGNLCTIKYALNLEQYEVAQQLRNKLTEVVLITSNGASKLGDFGFAISNDQSSDSARHSIML
ncbi:hypothetical protein C2S52_011516 [Perilla frutescens var. hirtella]|nr:hypothetical protein C2S52_011516 [Perilla frutescens var. hirtella]KAH6785830.1 hypothetical protein C2S51_038285 [Perilla frutescens var. frutescens]